MIKGKKKKVCRAYSNIKGSERYSSMSQLSHLSLIDEHLKLSNLSPDLVLFADEVMDTLGQLLLGREEGERKKKEKVSSISVFTVSFTEPYTCWHIHKA